MYVHGVDFACRFKRLEMTESSAYRCNSCDSVGMFDSHFVAHESAHRESSYEYAVGINIEIVLERVEDCQDKTFIVYILIKIDIADVNSAVRNVFAANASSPCCTGIHAVAHNAYSCISCFRCDYNPIGCKVFESELREIIAVVTKSVKQEKNGHTAVRCRRNVFHVLPCCSFKFHCASHVLRIQC